MSVTVVTVLIWASLALLAYTYVGYPVLVAVLGKLFPLRVEIDPGWLPRVSALIARKPSQPSSTSAGSGRCGSPAA